MKKPSRDPECPRCAALRAEIAKIEARNARARAENRRLKAELDKLPKDSST
jgi:hypothetical protein